jgi:hypothetical protein
MCAGRYLGSAVVRVFGDRVNSKLGVRINLTLALKGAASTGESKI